MADLREMNGAANSDSLNVRAERESSGSGGGIEQNPASDRREPQRNIAFVGRGSSLFGIHVKNILLTILTLGIYTFWARTNIRQFFWRKTLIFGEPLEYNGTGMELFVSFFWVSTFFFLASLAFNFTGLLHPGALVGIVCALVFFFLLLVPFAQFSALRYRLTRTTWRGTICYLEGNALDYAMQVWGRSVLIVVTLGLYTPWAVKYLAEYMVSRCHFGNQSFWFQNKIGKLFGPFIFCWLLGVAGLTLIAIYAEPLDELFVGVGAGLLAFAWLYYSLAKLRWKINGIGLQGAKLHSRLSLISFLGLLLTNLLLVVCTLGLGLPWAQVRWYRYLARRTRTVGELDFASMEPVAYEVPASGEGLLSWLNMGLGF